MSYRYINIIVKKISIWYRYWYLQISPSLASTFYILECILTKDWFNTVQKWIILRTSQSDASMFTDMWFVEFVSPYDKIFTVLPESQKLTVPSVSTRMVTLCRFLWGRETYFWNSPSSLLADKYNEAAEDIFHHRARAKSHFAAWVGENIFSSLADKYTYLLLNEYINMSKPTPFSATLKQICNEYHKRISQLEATKIDVEYEVAKKEYEVRGDNNHLRNVVRICICWNNSRCIFI